MAAGSETSTDCISNPIFEELRALGFGREPRPFFPRTRDADIPVWRDATGILFLQEVATSNAYYEAEKPESRAHGATVVQTRNGSMLTSALEDADRRLAQFGELIAGKRVCDFGCGHGDWIGRAHMAGERFAVELRGHCLDYIAEHYPEVRTAKSIEAFDDLEVVTLFHVLEHIPAQREILRQIRSRMRPGGLLVVEVPHANDHLIHAGPEAFKSFTFWSEHLVLHTRDSLQALLADAGFADVSVEPFQRYGLANHRGWFEEGRPGGHVRHTVADAEDLAYREDLARRWATDTIIALARA
ncbi:MAG: class I SAM-dependent methyltransferase [Phenylobacterium sp.]|uniref:class I SAM-dependent methyltransferase n=1 Tax=Phenylobacterium sp. TaxID=1871053 RepID=UPI00391D0EE6